MELPNWSLANFKLDTDSHGWTRIRLKIKEKSVKSAFIRVLFNNFAYSLTYPELRLITAFWPSKQGEESTWKNWVNLRCG